VLVAGALLACTSYGDQGSAPADAGTSGTPDGTPSHGLDAAPADAGTDAKTDVDGAAPTCPAGAFCDSFERSEPIGPWAEIKTLGTCAVAIDGTKATEGASSLLVRTTASDAGSCEAAVFRSFPGPLTHLSLAFDVRVSATPDRELHFLAYLEPTRTFFFYLTPTGFYLVEQDDAALFDAHPLGSLPVGSFHRVLVDYGFSDKKMLVSVDGATRLDITSTQTYGAASYQLAGGTTHSSPGSAIDFWIDDYRFVPTK
jgi:hypothetical protein